MELKKATDYAKMMVSLKDNDLVAADELTMGLAANFAFKNTEYSSLEKKKAIFIGNNMQPNEKGKFPPKTRLEAEWDASPDGMYMIALYRERQSMKILLKAIENHCYTMRTEATIGR